jgi:hypothetical protein
LHEDEANLMQAWSEDGAALVRPWCGEGVFFPEIAFLKSKSKYQINLTIFATN